MFHELLAHGLQRERTELHGRRLAVRFADVPANDFDVAGFVGRVAGGSECCSAWLR
jgi:hypothetical protein